MAKSRPLIRLVERITPLLLLIIAACAAPIITTSSERNSTVNSPSQAGNQAWPIETTNTAEDATLGQNTVPTPVLASTPATNPLYRKPANVCSTIPPVRGVLFVEWSRRHSQNLLSLVEPESGNPICGFDPIPIGQYWHSAISPDRKTLAIAIFSSNTNPNGALHLIDLVQWKATPPTIEFSNWVSGMAFSPDGNRLAVAYAGPPQGIHSMPEDYRLVLIDFDSGEVIAERRFDFMPKFIEFMPDGESLAVYGAPVTENNLQGGDPHAALLDGENLDTLWEVELPGLLDGQIEETGEDGSKAYSIWYPGLTFSMQRSSLYIVHPDVERLTTVDFKHLKTTSVDILPATTWLERFLSWTAGVAQAKTLDGTTKFALLSPGEERIYVVGRTGATRFDANGGWQFEDKALGLQVLSPEDGAELARLDTEATEITLSPDGKFLFLRGWAAKPWTEVIDATSLKLVKRLTGRHLVPGSRLDGSHVLLSRVSHFETGYTTLSMFDPKTLTEIIRWLTRDYADWLIVSKEVP